MDYICGNVRACIKQEINNKEDIAKQNINRICADTLTQMVCKEKYKKTFKQLLFDKLIKYKKIDLIYTIINKQNN